MSKFAFGPKRKVVCAYAGGPSVATVARNVALHAEEDLALDGEQWKESLRRSVRAIKRPDGYLNELIVCRLEPFELWLVSQLPDYEPNVNPITKKIYTGATVSARFLMELYSPDLSLSDARSLALLTLSFAGKQDPTNKRGTAEQWIKEGKQAVKMTRLSCHRFRSNQARLALSLLAYNLGNLWRRLALPKRIENWSLTSLQQRLVKTGGRLVKHARYYWLLLAESHLTRRLFGSMVRRIAVLSLPAG